MCSGTLQLRCIGTKGRSCSHHIIPNTYNFILKETCIYLYGVALFKSLGTNLFLHLCAMNCRPLSIDLDMGKTIDGSRQLTYKCRESLVVCLVALLATCRDTCPTVQCSDCARHGHRTEKDKRGSSVSFRYQIEALERRMPIDKQRDYAVECQD